MAATIEAIVRLAVVSAPVAALAAIALRQRPGLRQRMAALLASIAALMGIVVLNVAAERFDWWRFDNAASMILGQPVDLLLVWAVVWGAIPTLLDRWRLSVTLSALAALDLVVMPLVPGVRLGHSWVVGEGVALLVVATPAIVLGRLTAQRRHLALRVALQVTVVAGLLLAVVPLAAAALGDSLSIEYGILSWLGLQVAVVGAVLALAAVWEFYRRGQGTPWPWDPPRRLVTSGPYRYVSNPMQLGAIILLVGEAIVVRSAWILAIAATSAAFAATTARLHESATAALRYGDGWGEYHRAVPAWRLRWRPSTIGPATLWVAESCDTCSGVGRWLTQWRPAGLTIGAAEEHPFGPPRRATYEAADGFRATGVDAFASALEHLNLAWAMIGFVLRLPVVRTVARVIGDATGFGPRDIAARTREEVVTCPRTETLAHD